MLEIDGSYGEGGGQLVRTAVALAAVTGRGVRIRGIRARRRTPGLAAQHLTAIRAVAALAQGELEGDRIGSMEIAFRPRALRGGEYRFAVGTAGSITLVLQALLPVAVSAPCPSAFRITGGTDVPASPPLDYLRWVLLPILGALGVEAKVECLRRGYYPRGGGEVAVEVRPGRLGSLVLEGPGPLQALRGYAHVAGLPRHVLERMDRAARAQLGQPVELEEKLLGAEEALGSGGALVLVAETAHTRLGASAVAQRGVPAERLGSTAAQALIQELACGATLDLHASDQVLVYLALAGGISSFYARALTAHAATTLWLLQQFLPLRWEARPEGSCTRIRLECG
ncbi:MAG: RNA 3'-terminal phosphate cyclase [Pseudomonadota bacterium]